MQRRRQHSQGIEPAAGLIHGFDNKIGREMVFKPFLVVKRVVNLRVRHGTGLKPAVKDVADAAHHGFAGRIVRVRINDLVNIRLVQVGNFDTGLFFDFGNGTKDINARKLRIVRFPDRNRRSPKTIARNRPVAGAFQPFAETAVLNVLRNPGNLLIVSDHIVTEVGYLDKPA